MTARRGAGLRVLITADAVGGVWQFALDLARALRSEGAEILIAVTGPEPSPAQRAEAAAIPGLRFAHAPFRLEWMDGAERDAASAERWLRRLARGFAPDVIHASAYSFAAAWPHHPVLLTAHSCVRTWWRAVHGCEPPARWGGYVARVAAGLAAAGVVVAPSRAHLSAITACYGPLACGVAIPNGRSPRPRAGIAKEPVILAAGRVWDEGKNLGVLEAVAPRLEWPVYVAGPLAAPGGDASPADGHCRYLGRLEDAGMGRRLAAASIFVSPARYEPFGLAALDAALAGCALVLSDIPTHRELWDGGALFVDPDDPAAIAGALARLTRDTDLRRSLAARAFACARRYPPERTAAGYLATCLGLAFGTRPTRGTAAAVPAAAETAS